MTVISTTAVSQDVARRMYTTMTLAAACDERLRRGILRGEFAATIWPSRGQEAIPAGMGAALRTDDRLVTTYRGLHDLIGKGVPLTQVIGEVLGHSVGASRGKGGTMHITAPEQGVMLCTGIVGAGVPVAVGLALAAVQQGSDRVAAVCFGDGATNTGSFHEGMNLASTWQLPVIFVCQNNLFAEMTPIGDTMHIDQVADRALAYAMPGLRIDGNDPEAVYQAVTVAAERSRGGGGPTLLECVTFRFKGHYTGDQMSYMPPDELAAAEAVDPIPRYRQKLLDNGVSSEDELAAIDEQATQQVDTALQEVLAASVPGLDELEKDFFVDMKGIPA
ncbi:Pyruvate dehydrogenase (Acetyl-transferring) [Frankia sp. Hr75.2]|uniref:thiamine pyrophosphate-dependent dehydrogenase E1 component subunit alpha n=2 Tax=unclassified Parafrankia TaxID=2994368 RepID=UPI000DA52A5C|nr:thiamine pyrophosphate-dependent dehydrogenase E1 component subunit alpha [Parafrankia sp. Ea1.12]CAI7980496.1 Pyruvate dehydrogenase (Acetyl-transferring) [Frankia sp. Hr75.2]SQD99064.1 Pyruvate dehydrogenase (Acetyl-transferring) [Parafrankia sp. Ea1.12]